MGIKNDGCSQNSVNLPRSYRWDLFLLTGCCILGSAAAYLSINIPETEVFIEIRWLFGLFGFTLIHRLPLAFLLPAVLSLAGFHKLPLHIVFLGNMLYALPFCFFLRAAYRRVVVSIKNLFVFGSVWFLLIVAGYQFFQTPLLRIVQGILRDTLTLKYVLEAYRLQFWIEESIVVAAISAFGMVIIRMYFLLQNREEHLYTILRSIGDGVIVTDTEERIELINPVAEALTGYSLRYALGEKLSKVFRIVYEETGKPCGNPIQKVMDTGLVFGLANHTMLLSRDGRRYQIADSGAPIRGNGGEITGVVLVFRDVTEEHRMRKKIDQDLKEKEILLGEVHHRVKNNLQIVSSLLTIQAGVASDEAISKVLRDVGFRIYSMSLVHDHLYQTGAFSGIEVRGYVQDLVNELLASLSPKAAVEVSIDIPEVTLDLQTIIPCGLILNELITNSLKHAFNDREKGRIIVSFRKGENGEYILTYEDNGMGIQDLDRAEQVDSIGLLLVRGLIQQLEGWAELYTDFGTKYVITFPGK